MKRSVVKLLVAGKRCPVDVHVLDRKSVDEFLINEKMLLDVIYPDVKEKDEYENLLRHGLGCSYTKYIKVNGWSGWSHIGLYLGKDINKLVGQSLNKMEQVNYKVYKKEKKNRNKVGLGNRSELGNNESSKTEVDEKKNGFISLGLNLSQY